LGSAGFAEWIKAQFYPSKIDDEVPQAKDLVPDTARIVNVVSEFYGISEADLYLSKRGYFNEPRNVAIYLARRLRRDTLTQLCKDFSINKYSSVSSIMARVEQRMSEDKKLKENITQIKAIIKKSQKQI
jgi:chromosomal replication initiation ATPase DnaA